jgi:hypothetical protein
MVETSKKSVVSYVKTVRGLLCGRFCFVFLLFVLSFLRDSAEDYSASGAVTSYAPM